MLGCVDVAYLDTVAIAGCLLFDSWGAAKATSEHLATTPRASDYRPGEFYLRELPAILAVLRAITIPLETIIIDGYVWLGSTHPGLGARLFDALDARIPIVGVAKTGWGGEPAPATDPHRAIGLLRGQSAKRLHVSAEGIDVDAAARHVASMHGEHRMPTLLKEVDSLVRRTALAMAPQAV